MTTPYAFTVELARPLGRAVETLRAALAADQTGGVSEVDVQATLKTRLGIESHPRELLGICRPKVARVLLNAEPDIGALQPCGCSAAEARPGRSRIALKDRRISTAFELARAALRRMLARLEHQEAEGTSTS